MGRPSTLASLARTAANYTLFHAWRPSLHTEFGHSSLKTRGVMGIGKFDFENNAFSDLVFSSRLTGLYRRILPEPSQNRARYRQTDNRVSKETPYGEFKKQEVDDVT